jgi:hypothetical protein
MMLAGNTERRMTASCLGKIFQQAGLFFLPVHDIFLNINKIATSKHKETHPVLETAGRSGWYLYNRMMGSFCQ